MTARIVARRTGSRAWLAALGLSLAIHGSAATALVLWQDGPRPRPVGGAAAIAVVLVTGPGARAAAVARPVAPHLAAIHSRAVALPRQPAAVMPPRATPKTRPVRKTRLVPKLRPARPSVRPRRRPETTPIARRQTVRGASTGTPGIALANGDGMAGRSGRGAAPLADNPPPVYPRRARRRGYQGRVVLRVRVRANGSSAAIDVFKSSGYTLLDRAAVRAVRTWRFAPARRAGVAVPAVIAVPVRFRLED